MSLKRERFTQSLRRIEPSLKRKRGPQNFHDPAAEERGTNIFRKYADQVDVRRLSVQPDMKYGSR